MKRVVMLVMVLTLCLSGTALAAQKYINGIDKDYPPFAFINEVGKPSGFDVDSMNWIAKKMGFTVEHKAFEWKSIIQMLVENKIQMICSGMSITPERSKQVAFSDPYWNIRKVLIAKKDSKLTTANIMNDKVKLGVQQGTDEVNYLKKMLADKKANFELVQYSTPSDAIADVLNGRIQAAAMDAAPAENAMNMGRAVKEIGTFGETVDFGVAVNKSNPELLKQINEGYKLLKADPYWNELKKRYKLN